MKAPGPLCYLCRHYPGHDRACAAFAAGIPDPIWHNQADHREPYPGDQGIRFEPKPELDAAALTELLRWQDKLLTLAGGGAG